jgi:hypothetical protein
MKYQLVLQFQAESVYEFDEFVVLDVVVDISSLLHTP